MRKMWRKSKMKPVDKNDNYYVVLRSTTHVVFVSSSINYTISIRWDRNEKKYYFS